MPDTNTTPLFNDLAVQAGENVRANLKKLHMPDFIVDLWAAGVAAGVTSVGVMVGALVALYVKLAIPVAKAFLDVLGRSRKEIQPGLNPLIGSALSEMLGVEITGDDLPPPDASGNVSARVEAIGSKVYQQLIKEFVPESVVTPESGEKAAKAFAGFGINFAIVNSFISILAELASDDHLEQWREIGVEIAENLGLGRLQRRALGVMIENVIQKPYDAQLRARYRPDRLTDVQYIKAFQSGRLKEEDLRKELAYKGYREDYIDELLLQLLERPSDAQLEALVRWGNAKVPVPLVPLELNQLGLGEIPKLTTKDAVDVLKNAGMSEDLAKQRLVAISLSRAEGEVATYADRIATLAVHRDITIEQASELLQGLPLTPIEFSMRLANIGLQLETPHKSLSIAEVQQAFVDGTVDLDYTDRWLEAEGYSSEDQLILTLRFLLAAKKEADREKAAADKVARKLARGGK